MRNVPKQVRDEIRSMPVQTSSDSLSTSDIVKIVLCLTFIVGLTVSIILFA
jgi:hypothetical protein